jgi:hypothetical protein
VPRIQQPGQINRARQKQHFKNDHVPGFFEYGKKGIFF